MRPLSRRAMRVGLVTAILGGLVLVPVVDSVAATPRAHLEDEGEGDDESESGRGLGGRREQADPEPDA
jgi:hypothetical protein